MEAENLDLFSNHSKSYATNRPKHPKDLFDYLTKNLKEKRLAWDVATGSGQAAVMLSEYFENVIATDLSNNQLSQAIQKPNIKYATESCEDINSTLIPENSVDLITVAVAIHWFPFEQFYKRVNKVLKKGGIIAAWVYFHPEISEQVNAARLQIEKKCFTKYNAERIKYVEEGYSTIPWPFKKPEWHTTDVDGVNKQFNIKKQLNLKQFCDYFRTASSAQLYLEDTGKDCTQEYYELLLQAWGNDPNQVKDATWNIKLLVGVKE